MTLTVGSLFSGIGGIDLGLERAGMRVVWQAETDPYASRVLAKHWPDVPNLGDVTTIDWENDALDHGDGIARSLHVDLVAGGFPCQPVSLNGHRRGVDDPRWLWPWFARALRVLRPRYALVENVPGLLAGPGMGAVLGDLADLGFDAEWGCVSACAMGAPHMRRRVFIVAHPKGQRLQRGRDCPPARGTGTQPQGRMDPSHWSLETRPPITRMAHGVPGRVDRLRAIGNAVVPQVAEYVGRRLIAASSTEAPMADARPDAEAAPPPVAMHPVAPR